jgi:hypothetical protein
LDSTKNPGRKESMMTFAPIVLFVYNRPDHTRRTIEALLKNSFADKSELFIFSDAAKKSLDETSVTAVRNYLATITGFKRVHIIERSNNYGLANNIIDGVTTIISRFNTVIVLEDDMITSPYFLQYMNEALLRYENEPRVVCIHGYVYPVKSTLPETFFLRGADCWGWATWQRGWNLFEKDSQKLLDELNDKNLIKEFDYDGAYPLTGMLIDQIKGRNNSWAIRWQASAFIKNKLTLYPGRSLIYNTGNDGTGVHSGSSNIFDTTLSDSKIILSDIPVEVNVVCRSSFVNYFNSIKPGLLKRIYYKFKTAVKNVIFEKDNTLS